jgi:SCY1-like protein 2
LHSVEETSDTLAFATEPVAASLGNVLAALEENSSSSSSVEVVNVQQVSQQPSSSANTSILTVAENHNGSRRNGAREISRPIEVQQFLDIEIKYGIYQV